MRKNVFKWQALLLVAFLSFGFVSCGGDDDDAPVTELSVDVAQLNLSADGQSQTFRITSNSDWTITGNPSWLTVNPSTGSKNKNIVVAASENTQTTERTCELQITTDDGQISEVIFVRQLARDKNPSEATPQEKILGTWKFYLYYNNNENPSDGRTYTFFDGGVYVYWSQQRQCYYDGTYSVSEETISMDGERTILDTFTYDFICFPIEGYKYEGKRIVESDSKLRDENKMKLVGTWLCSIPFYDGVLESQLILKEDGTYTNTYLDDNHKYMGQYYVAEDKIYFADPTGKDPLFFYDIQKLTNEQFELNNLDDEQVSAKKIN